MTLKRAVAYIDGFNLYHGLKSAGWQKYYWLDLCQLAANLIPDRQLWTLATVHYFTAPVLQEYKRGAERRQQNYLDALRTLSQLTIHYGKYFHKKMVCRKCGATWNKPEEKMSDVNLAVQLITDAYEGKFDTAFLISGDSDVTGPVRAVCQRFPDKEVRVAFPPRRHSQDLKKAANVAFPIWEKKFRISQLPDEVTTASGFVLTRPPDWY